MIRLEVEDYCQDCLQFTADVKPPEKLYGMNGIPMESMVIQSDTVVRCQYRKQCRRLMEYLKRHVETD